MAVSTQTTPEALRISPEAARRRLESGGPATVLDVRNPKAWASSPVQIRGATRIDPEHWQIDPSWPKDRFTLVY